jgi:hypothetical protein
MPSDFPGYQVEVPRTALVVRFRPTDPVQVLKSAQKAHRATGRYLLSVFADVAHEGESDDEVRQRLVDAAGLSGIKMENQKKCYICGQAKELSERGFTFWKDGDDDEQEEHYSLDLGDQATVDDVKVFLAAFPQEGRLS